MADGWKKWMAHRFGFKEILENFLIRRVPRDPWYAGDGMAMVMLFGIQLITGIILALSYSPSAEMAYRSVQYIGDGVWFGWFVRGLHYWAGGIWVVMLVYHLFRQILIGGYKTPREGTWLIGVVLLFLVVAMSFIGYTLRWDERAIYGISIVLNVLVSIPWIGEDLAHLVLGGPQISHLTLTRLYAMHAVLGPVVLVMLIGYHLYLIVIRGTMAPSEKEQPIHSAKQQERIYERDAQSEQKGETFHPETTIRLAPIPIATFMAVVALAYFEGAPQLYPEANLAERSFPREEWWLAWYSALAALLPAGISKAFHVLFPVTLFLVLVALPFVDRWKDNRGARNRPIAVTIVILCAIALLFLSSLRLRSPWTAWPQAQPPSVPAGVMLTPRVEEGRQLFARYGCNSCHAVAGSGPQFAPDLARIDVLYSEAALRQYVLEPPQGVAMPAYRGRITPEHLGKVVEFVMVAQTFPRGQQGDAPVRKVAR